MRRKRKTIVKIGRLLNFKRFICKKAQFVINALLDWKKCNFLSIGVMCSNFDVFETTRARVFCMRCMGPLHNYVTPKMAVFYPPTHPVTLSHVSPDPPTHPPQRDVIIQVHAM